MNRILLTFLTIALSLGLSAQKNKTDDPEDDKKGKVTAGLKWRSLGPGLKSGRISDLAVVPNSATYYVAVASGGVFKTENWGVTYKPIFDKYGSYSIGCIAVAPTNPHIVWVGTGENNNQRSVAYGDGVYKSEDGGKSFKNMGLKTSEHIGKIIIHPSDPNTVWVAAYGPLWSAGGERGVYKTTDGGANWELVLELDEHTGASDLIIDPRDPNVLYAAAHQRRRHVWTYISGGPGSAIYKSDNGGADWKKLEGGLPNGKMGRIGLAISPVNPDYIYAIAEGMYDKAGTYRSTDRGASWKKMGDYVTSGNYYSEIYCDLANVDKVYSMDTWFHHTIDGGKTWKKTGEKNKHVDNHAMWQNQNNLEHWLVGCDGGIYETYDNAKTWHYKDNLPITQFYKLAVDNAEPFYNVYGGTQDNNTIGGASRTFNNAGILNSDWYITNGGDGFEPQIDPTDPNIVYGQAQYGWLIRYDKASGERIGIQPQPGKDEKAYRWNWDAPLLISPHDHKTLYFCANKVFKSTDRGNSWQTLSDDLSRGLDRNALPVMGRVWSIDAVAKNRSTSIYGTIVAFDESPVKKGLIYAGTDDGLIHVSEDDGANWRKIDDFTGIPERTYVNMIVADVHDENTVYAVFNNHKNGDFKPYILVSKDKGKSWTAMQGDLPERGSVYAFAQDHVDADLMFAGTEFGLFYTKDAGAKWEKLGSGLPTVAIRDIAIQRRENDLVLASFGRGFYVLDDYTPLRDLSEENMEKEIHMFPIKDALRYMETNPLGLRGAADKGAGLYRAENPMFGAVFTYHMKKGFKSLKDQRKKKEAKIRKDGGDNPYPSWEDVRKEKREQDAFLVFVIRDAEGNEVQRLKHKAEKGMKRVNWDLRLPSTAPIKLKSGEVGRYSSPERGPMAPAGNYTVEVHHSYAGETTKILEPVGFVLKDMKLQTLPEAPQDLLAFQKEVAELSRSVRGTTKQLNNAKDNLKYLKKAIVEYPNADITLLADVKNQEELAKELDILFRGDGEIRAHEVETLPGISSRVGTVVYQIWSTNTSPTQTQRDQVALAREDYALAKPKVEELMAGNKALEEKLSAVPIPFTPGREDWKEE